MLTQRILQEVKDEPVSLLGGLLAHVKQGIDQVNTEGKKLQRICEQASDVYGSKLIELKKIENENLKLEGELKGFDEGNYDEKNLEKLISLRQRLSRLQAKFIELQSAFQAQAKNGYGEYKDVLKGNIDIAKRIREKEEAIRFQDRESGTASGDSQRIYEIAARKVLEGLKEKAKEGKVTPEESSMMLAIGKFLASAELSSAITSKKSGIGENRDWSARFTPDLEKIRRFVPWDKVDKKAKKMIESIQVPPRFDEKKVVYQAILKAIQMRYTGPERGVIDGKLMDSTDYFRTVESGLRRLFTNLTSVKPAASKIDIDFNGVRDVKKSIQNIVKTDEHIPGPLKAHITKVLELLHKKNSYEKGFAGRLKILANKEDYEKTKAELQKLVSSLPQDRDSTTDVTARISKERKGSISSSENKENKESKLDLISSEEEVSVNGEDLTPSHASSSAPASPDSRSSSSVEVKRKFSVDDTKESEGKVRDAHSRVEVSGLFASSPVKWRFDFRASDLHFERVKAHVDGLDLKTRFFVRPEDVARRLYEDSKMIRLIKEASPSKDQVDKATKLLEMIDSKINEVIAFYNIKDPRELEESTEHSRFRRS